MRFLTNTRKEAMLYFLRAVRTLGLTLFVSVGAALAAQAAHLTVSSIEVTQAVQTPTNTIPLVAYRSTAVRATVQVTGSLTNISGVSGRLHVFVGGVEITPTAGIAPINAPFTAKLSPQRSNEDDTLNFELPAPTGITPSSQVRFRVDLTHRTVPTTSLTTPNMTFSSRLTPRLFFTRINYTPSGLGLPPYGKVLAGRGDAFVRGILPVNDGAASLYRQGPFPTLTYTKDTNGNGILDGTDRGELLSLLESCRQLIVENGVGADNRVFLYGWINGNPIDGNGRAIINGRVAFGNTQDSRYQRTFAHELTHNFGFDHNGLSVNQIGWDVGGRLLGNPVGNNVSGRVKPLSLYDIQNPGRLTEQAWIRTDIYSDLFSHPTLLSDTILPYGTNALVVQGIFDPSGGRLLKLKPIFRYPWPSQASVRFRENPTFVARVRFADGSVQPIPFDPKIADDPEGEETEEFGEFSLTIPVNGVVDSVSIENAAGQVFGRIVRSAKAPSLQITSPRRGQQLFGKVRVTWNATDEDTPLSNLMFQAAYSPDGGQSYVPVGVDIVGSSLEFDSGMIKPGDNGILKIFASDGFNTVEDQVPVTPPLAITGRLDLEGFNDPSLPAVQVDVRYPDNVGNITVALPVNPDGTFTLYGIRPVDLTLRVKADRWLAVAKPLTSAQFHNANFALRGGDANNDNSVDALDLADLITAFNTAPGDATWNEAVDFNGDAAADALDLAILINNFNIEGDP